MTIAPPDGSRDRRIEDRTNLWIIHLAGRALLPWAIGGRVSANAVSIAGLALGAGAAIAYGQWPSALAATLGFALSVAWLIADGLDGMIARATRTASAFGRFLDGLCDHGVFILIYLALALSIGTIEGWALTVAAGIAHIVQSSLYEAERARFHRRVRGDWGAVRPARIGNAVERLYDDVARGVGRLADPFDRALQQSSQPDRLGAAYGDRAAPAMRLMILLTANTRVMALYAACLATDPRYFWWFEIAPLSLVALAAIVWLRRVETGLIGAGIPVSRLST